MPRYLVTGAAGFIGSHLSEQLLRDGDEVLGVDRFSNFYGRADKESNLRILKESPGFEFREMDLCKGSLEGISEGIDGVFHLAAQAGVRDSWGEAFSVYLNDNNLATQRLLEEFRDRPIHAFVYASSSSVYGDALEGPTTEDATPKPISPYGVSKLGGEYLCYLYFRNFGIHTVSVRYFTVYGPRQRPDMAFHRFLKAGLAGEPITVYGDGEQSRDFTFVTDAVAGTKAAMTKGKAGIAYNIGGGQRATVNEVIGYINELQEMPLKVNREDVQKGDVRHTWADTTRAAADLGFRPRTDMREGLKAEREWLIRRTNE